METLLHLANGGACNLAAYLAAHVLLCLLPAFFIAIAWGTYLGGWRIVKTMGSKITKLTPVSGSCASMGGALSLGLATLGGIPVSTTHTITGAIVGVGTAQDVKAVRWAVTMNLVVAWVLTIPASGG